VHVRTFAALEAVFFPRFIVPKRWGPLQRVPLGSQAVIRPRERIVSGVVAE